MKKFRDYIYVDEERMNSYLKQIDLFKKRKVSESYEKDTEFNGEIKLPLVGTGTTLNEKKSDNYSINTDNLEFFIDWANDNNNAINYDGKSLSEKTKDSLIVLSGTSSIPEMVENLEMLSNLRNNMNLYDMIPIPSDEKQIISFMKEIDNIPILLDCDSNYVFSFNLKKKCMRIPLDDFYDNIGEKVIIIAKIEMVYNNTDSIEIFDLVKEVFNLNRIIRRKIPKENLENAILKETGPLVKIFPIVIYK